MNGTGNHIQYFVITYKAKESEKKSVCVCIYIYIWASLVVKNLPAMQESQEMWVHSLIGKITWRRAWQLTPVFLPGESYGQRNLANYSPWGRKESDTTEVT